MFKTYYKTVHRHTVWVPSKETYIYKFLVNMTIKLCVLYLSHSQRRGGAGEGS